MRKVLLAASAFFILNISNAQPWLESFSGQSTINIKDVMDAYEKKTAQRNDEDKIGEEALEGKDYHYNRWLWYHQNRVDENGNLMSPLKTWLEVQKMKQTYSNRASSKTTSVNVNWTFHGPTNPLGENKGIGRINVIEFHPTDTNTYIIGSAGGGMWRTTDDGVTWKVLDDFLPVLGVSDIDYNHQNPNTIYVCTGDRDANDNFSVGVLKSTDGGATWNQTGFKYSFATTKKTAQMLINPLDTNSLTLATSDGIYKSYNGAATWSLQQGGDFRQLLYCPSDTSIILAAGFSTGSWEVHRSADGGKTWQEVSNFPTIVRFEMAVTPANPAIVKVITANTDYGMEGFYNSTDTGKTFTKIFDDNGCKNNILDNEPRGNTCGGQGWYDISVAISPVDPNLVIVGGVNTWFSTNGGTSWTQANQWKNQVTGVTLVHADKHCHKFNPLRPGVLYECNDGGIFKTLSPNSKNGIWNDLTEGLGITQFYRNAVSGGASFVLGGAQDNGTKMLVGGTSMHMTGADGMDCQINPSDSNNFYTSQQYGELRRTTDGGAKFTDIQNNIPNKGNGAWITPFVILPSNHNALIAGYDTLFYTTNQGDSWIDLPGAMFGNVDRIALTPLDPQVIVVNVNSSIRYTFDFGNKWTTAPTGISGKVSDIAIDPINKNKLWLTIQSYTGDKVATYMMDNTQKWEKQNANLPEVPVNCIAFDEINKTMYIGTDLGVYYREFHDTNWTYFNNTTLPNVEVIDLGINYTTGEIWAATYGRGMWSSPLHKSTLSVETIAPLAEGVVTVIPNPNTGTFNIKTNNAELTGKHVTVQVVSMTGAVAFKNNILVGDNGYSKVNADLPRGVYIVEVIKDNIPFAKTKMLIQ